MTTLTNKANKVCANCSLVVESDYACEYCGDYKNLLTVSEYESIYGEFTGY